jgi:hypothetical protein
MSSHNLIGDAEFQQVIGDFTPSRNINHIDNKITYPPEYQHEVSLVVNTTGLHSFTVIFQLQNPDGTPSNFNHERYQIWLSDNAYDNPPLDEFDYEHQFVLDPRAGWIFLRDVDLGVTDSCNNSFSESSAGTRAAEIHFTYVKFIVPEITGKRIIISSGSR